MKKPGLTVGALAASLALLACTSEEGAEAAAPAGGEGAAPEIEVDLPSQEELDAQAEAEITEENADEEFDKLMQEVGDDGE